MRDIQDFDSLMIKLASPDIIRALSATAVVLRLLTLRSAVNAWDI